MATKKAELAVVETKGIPAELAALSKQYAANAGMESVEATDLKLPSFRILQPTSKEVVPGNEKYIQDARVGQILEGSISKELTSELKIVPVHVIKGYSEFKDQKQGGGFLGFYPENHDRVAKSVDSDWCTKVTPDGTLLKHTFQLFVLVDPIGKGKPELGMMSFTGGALSDIKKFLSFTMSLGMPLFSKEYAVTTYPKNNPSHNSTTFRPTFNVDKSVFVPAEVFKAAGDIQSKLDGTRLQAILDASVQQDDAESTSAVEDSMS